MDELDELSLSVAKARGESTEHLPPKYAEWVTPDGEDGGSGFACPRCGIDESGYIKPCFRKYATDYNAAFELLREMGPGATLHRDDNGRWSCWVGNKMFTASHDCETAPEAISHCWLAWKEGTR